MSFNGTIYDKLYKDKPYKKEVERVATFLVGTTVLDIGGGTGMHAALLKEKGFEPHVIDLSESMLSNAAARGLSTELADITTYRSLVQYDNAIALFHVLNFCPDLSIALRNIHASLKDGGILVFDLWDSRVKKTGGAWRFDGLLTRYSNKYWRENEVFITFLFPFLLRVERNHLYCPLPNEVKQVLAAAGFELDTFEEDGLNYFIVARKHG